MWWIAACLGALLWLLVVRIKLKEKQRNRELDERQAQVQAAQRAELVKQAFLPTARRYFAEHAEIQTLALLFAVFEWPNRASEVHVCVVPVRGDEARWPELLKHGQWLTEVGGHWAFDAPEAHWNAFAKVGESAAVAAFGPLFTPVPDTTPFEQAYRLYALARRPGGVLPELEVVGEPAF